MKISKSAFLILILSFCSKIIFSQTLISLSPNVVTKGDGNTTFIANVTGVNLFAPGHSATVRIEFGSYIRSATNEVVSGINEVTFDISFQTIYYSGFYDLVIYDSLGVAITFPAALEVLPWPIPLAPVIVTPVNNQIFTTFKVPLDWNVSVGSYMYFVEVSQDTSFIGVVGNYSSTSSYRTRGLANGNYFWRVRGVNNDFVPGPWSQTGSFNVNAVASLLSISPDSSFLGRNALRLELSGDNVSFSQTTSTMSFSLDQGSTSIDSIYNKYDNLDSVFFFDINIPSNVPLGLYDVNYSNTTCGPISLLNGFTIDGSNHYEGLIYFDIDLNGMYSVGDILYNNATVLADQFATLSNINGEFGDYLPQGNFTISVGGLPPYYTCIPANYQISFSGTDSIIYNKNFAIQLVPGFHDLFVSLNTWTSNIRPGATVISSMRVKNLGPEVENGQFWFLPPPNLVFDSVSLSGYFMSGDTLFWDYDSLQMQENIEVRIFMTAPFNIAIGTQIYFSAGVLGSGTDYNPIDNNCAYTKTVVNAVDPNYKEVSREFISIIDIPSGTYLDYTIYFQNTGTAEALIVRILDTLSSNLDLSTFQLISASHPYRTIFYQNRVVEFRFDNINLPDSGTNELLSHGFIKYRIKANTTLTVTDRVLNTAYIYFDLNEPVITNTCMTSIAGVSVDEISDSNVKITIAPNPVSSKTIISYELKNSGLCDLIIFDQHGKAIKSLHRGWQSAGNYKIEIDSEDLISGIYYLKLINDKTTGQIKIVVAK